MSNVYGIEAYLRKEWVHDHAKAQVRHGTHHSNPESDITLSKSVSNDEFLSFDQFLNLVK